MSEAKNSSSGSTSSDSKSSSSGSTSSDSSSSSDGAAGKSTRDAVGGAKEVHYGYFSSVRNENYRSGWDDIWGKKEKKSGKRKQYFSPCFSRGSFFYTIWQYIIDPGKENNNGWYVYTNKK